MGRRGEVQPFGCSSGSQFEETLYAKQGRRIPKESRCPLNGKKKCSAGTI